MFQFSMRALFVMISLACLVAFVLAMALAPRPQRWFVNVVSIVWNDMSIVRIYTVSIPGSRNEEKRAYYDFPPYGSLDMMSVTTSQKARNYVSKARNYSGRAPEFTAEDEADFAEVALFVERRRQGRWVLRHPMYFKFEQKGQFNEQQSRVSDVFRSQP